MGLPLSRLKKSAGSSISMNWLRDLASLQNARAKHWDVMYFDIE